MQVKRWFPRYTGITLFTKTNVISFLLCLYMQLKIMQLSTGSSYLSYLGFLIACVIGMFGVVRTINVGYWLITLFVFEFSWISHVLSMYASLSTLMFLFNGLIAYTLLQHKLNYRVFYISYLIIFCSILVRLNNGVDPNKIFVNASRNMVSFNVFVNLVLLHYIEYINNRRLSFIPVVLMVIISVMSIGRSGIVSALIYLLFIMYYYFRRIPLKHKIPVLVIICFVVLWAGRLLLPIIDDIYKSYFYRLTNKGIDYSEDVRAEFLRTYIDRLTTISFFFGFNLYTDPYFARVGYNPHNSLLSMHNQMGFMVFPVILLLLLKMMDFIKNRELFLLTVLLLLLLRAWNDSVFFPGSYDFLIFIILFYRVKLKMS